MDNNIPIIVAVIAGLFALLGGFFGAWLARRTEYEKWLRKERSATFAEFLKHVHSVREKATDLAQFTAVGYKFNRWIDPGYWQRILS